MRIFNLLGLFRDNFGTDSVFDFCSTHANKMRIKIGQRIRTYLYIGFLENSQLGQSN